MRSLPAMLLRPRNLADFRPALQALTLYVLFVGGAWVALRLTSGSRLGILLGPVAAQAMMALVIFSNSRSASGQNPAPPSSARCGPLHLKALVLIAAGGFLFQATLLAGSHGLRAASIPALKPTLEMPLMWTVLLLTSVVGAPFLEERFFRGMLQPLLARRSMLTGLLASAALFGVAHGFEVPFRAIPAFLQGLIFGGLTVLTGRLRAATVVHILNNSCAMAVALILSFHPPVVPDPSPPAAMATAAMGLLGLALLGFGFHRIARQPGVVAPRPMPNDSRVA